MLTESEINKRWIKLLTNHRVKLGPPDLKAKGPPQHRWGIGFCRQGLNETGIDEHLKQMIEAMKLTATDQGFQLTDTRGGGLEFQDDPEHGQLGFAIFYGPSQPASKL